MAFRKRALMLSRNTAVLVRSGSVCVMVYLPLTFRGMPQRIYGHGISQISFLGANLKRTHLPVDMALKSLVNKDHWRSNHSALSAQDPQTRFAATEAQ